MMRFAQRLKLLKFTLQAVLVAGATLVNAADGLVGYWPLDEGAGNVLDELSGHSSAAVVRDGELLWARDGESAGLRFEKDRQQEISLPSSSAWDYAQGQEGALTICFRVKIEEPGWILDHRFGGIPGAWGFMVQGKRLVFSVYLDQPWEDDRKSVNLGFGDVGGAWHHIALVWKRGKDGWLKAYVDGVETDSADNVPVTASYVNPLAIGGRNSGGFGWATGCMKELAIFNRALEADRIAEIAKGGIQLNTPLSISLLRTGKILYAPDAQAEITTRVRNTSGQPQQATLELDLITLLRDVRQVATHDIDLAPGKSIVFSETAPLDGLDYGCEIRATVRQGENVVAEKREYFQVSDNMWAVGIGGTFGSALHTGLGKSDSVPELARKRYINNFELFFWSPCDWSLHLAPAQEWWSGQACYHQNEDELKALIQSAHEHGIKVAMYASCNPAGPFAWETARRHPGWFLDGRQKLKTIPPELVEQLDRWNVPEYRKTHGNPPWVVLSPDLRKLEILDYGIDRIIESAKAYDWDAVRFDGHYTIRGFDEISARNMRRLKERVWAEVPDFQFGYNYGRAPEWRGGVTHEMREAMAGGGLYLQEGIRRFRYTTDTYTGWHHYATNELRVAKMVKAMGGHYHCMWEVGNHPAPTAYYKFVYGLIAGGHPAVFDGNVPLSSDWGAFMTRWSGLLWDQALQREKTDGITVSDDRVQWQELVQEAVLDKNRKLVVIHLVNPPPDDSINDTRFPEKRAPFDVRFRAEEGALIKAVKLVSPHLRPFDIDIPVSGRSKTVRVAVPGLEHWTILAIELSGTFDPPSTPPKFSEPPDPQRVQAAMHGAVTKRIIDPNKDEVEVADDDSTEGVIHETNQGSSGIGGHTAIDTLADDGIAQMQTYEHMSKGHGQRFMGKTNVTMLQPGKYRVDYRIRWTAEQPDQFWKAILYVTVPNQENGTERTFRTQIASPNCWGDENGEAFIGRPDQYRAMEDAGDYHYYSVEVEVRFPTYISAAAIVDTNRSGGQKLFLDHIRIASTEPYGDEHLNTWFSLAKPGNDDAVVDALADALEAGKDTDVAVEKVDTKPLRVPNGQAPERLLEIRGVQAGPYGVAASLPVTTAYDLPSDYRALYDFDCVILVNFDCSFTTWEQRRILRDFVLDGGRLVVLGGIATLGQGAMKNTYLEELMPVLLKGDGEIVPCTPPAALDWPAAKSADLGVVLWRHDVSPRDQAQVLATAAGKPVLLRNPCGKGTVLVFAGTVLGDGQATPDVFWQKPAWGELLKSMALSKGD